MKALGYFTQSELEREMGVGIETEINKRIMRNDPNFLTCIGQPPPSFRDIKKDVVCKHYIRGLCKKGDECDFIHEYDLERMPTCQFFENGEQCMNPECVYKHDKEKNDSRCKRYLRGRCNVGARFGCNGKHRLMQVCRAYLEGFCPKGPDCLYGHPKWDVPDTTFKHEVATGYTHLLQRGYNNQSPNPLDHLCPNCKQFGHTSSCNHQATEMITPDPKRFPTTTKKDDLLYFAVIQDMITKSEQTQI